MKRMKKSILALLLAVLLLLTGCASTPPTEEEGTDTEAENLARIAALESELQKTREENYITESQLTKEIEDLKEKLAVLTGQSNSMGNGTGSSSMVFHYRVEDGGATITGYEGSCTLVQIPATLDGYTVKKIGERAFEGNTALAAVVVPEGVETIDWFAFYDCASLLDITIPASVSSIGHAVFDGCDGMTMVCPAGSYAESYAKSYGIAYINA